jgi:hypothetical protein
MNNPTPDPRESLILMFSPFWRKGRVEFAEHGKRLIREGKELTPRLKQMLGVELSNGSGNIYVSVHRSFPVYLFTKPWSHLRRNSSCFPTCQIHCHSCDCDLPAVPETTQDPEWIQANPRDDLM